MNKVIPNDTLPLFYKFKEVQPKSGDEVFINHENKLIKATYDGCGMFYDIDGEKYFENDWVDR